MIRNMPDTLVLWLLRILQMHSSYLSRTEYSYRCPDYIAIGSAPPRIQKSVCARIAVTIAAWSFL